MKDTECDYDTIDVLLPIQPVLGLGSGWRIMPHYCNSTQKSGLNRSGPLPIVFNDGEGALLPFYPLYLRYIRCRVSDCDRIRGI